MTAVEVFAPAKVNLTLHVTGQRTDGYHLLDSLVVFADVGDRVTLALAERPSFKVTGPFAASVPLGDENLVLRAARLCAPDRSLAIGLEKGLPPASGLGGGSADAAAVARGVAALTGGRPDPDALLALGADVPMCLASGAARVRGIGERIKPLAGLPALPAVLVNPGHAMPTPPVFAALKRKDNPPMSDPLPVFAGPAGLIGWLAAQRNDLEAPAMAILPEVSRVLAALGACEGVRLARMSGSGATCFALFDDAEAAARAAARLGGLHPGWWVRPATLGDQSARARPR
ncbi:4-(cytidine 5'-diphospho)-2-C-methyl-D-erythritol kinase [Palleronia sp. KMU-117]|uniref:4-(cytidine 5'-diphospho)-2-C-methyl-D-erythritol kinase n=1 Tax=Palleronia sp. KMU-117 TaxID=3434108 RepID=UPI003D73A9D0